MPRCAGLICAALHVCAYACELVCAVSVNVVYTCICVGATCVTCTHVVGYRQFAALKYCVRCNWTVGSYFYHFDEAGLANRLPWRLLRLQGLRNALFVGGSVCFESVNDIVAYNKCLCDALVFVK